MMRKILYIMCAAVALTMAGCKSDCTDCVFESIVPKTAQRAFLLYLATDNNLSSMGTSNLNALVKGATEQTLGNGVMFVLQDLPGTATQTKLVAIYIDQMSKKAQQKVVKTYSANLDTSLPATFTTVWNDIKAVTTAQEWVLSFGSHGNGWFPGNARGETRARRTATPWSITPIAGQGEVGTRSLLEDTDQTMSPEDFAGMLPAEGVEMIIMDACDMGCIEFAWELREKAKYLVLSPAEVIDRGFPYDKIVDDIFNTDLKAGAEGLCREYYNYYDTFSDSQAQYATVSLFDCSKFNDYAAALKTALAGKLAQIAALTEADIESANGDTGIKTFDRSGFGTSKGKVTAPVMYDMKEFLTTIGSWNSTVEAAQKALIPYSETTGKWFYNYIVVEKSRFSGVSTYIPADPESFADDKVKEVRNYLNYYWTLTSWAKEVFGGE